MKKFKGTKKIIALLLSLSLITGMMPAMAWNAFAAEEKTPVDAAIFFSDLHAMKNGTSNEGSNGYKKEIVTNIMTALKDSGKPFSSVTSVGDAFSSNETAYTGKTSIITGYIQGVLGNIPVNYTWSDHDRAALAANDEDLLENKTGLIYGAGKDGIYGNTDDANYYIYAISHSDTSSAERYGQKSTFTEQKVIDFKNDISALDNTKPVFIASHQPLFARRSDNQHAYKWCVAINEVAATRDVVLFHGHNHKYDEDGDYLFAKGTTMTVQDGSSTQNVKLNFTHINTGYMEPTSSTSYSNTTRQGVAVAATIYEDSMQFTAYDKDGVYDGDYALDETVTRDFAPEEEEIPDGYTLNSIEVANSGAKQYFVGESLNTEGLSVKAVYTKSGETDVEVTLTSDDYKISGYNKDTIGKQQVTVSYGDLTGSFEVEVFQKVFTDGAVTVEFNNYGVTSMTATSNEKNVDGYSAYVTYDITPVGYLDGTEAEVTIAVDTKLFDTKYPVSVLDNGTCIASPQIVNGKITFTTNHFSEYDVVQTSLDKATWIEIPGETTYTYTLDTNGVTANKNYLIASGGSGTVQLLTNNGSNNAGSTQVTVSSDSKITIEDDSNVAWVFSGSTSGTAKNNDRYIYLGSDAFLSTANRTLNFRSQENGAYLIQRSNSSYYVRYNNGAWSRTRNTANVYLFEKTGESTSNGGYATMTGPDTLEILVGQYVDSAAVQDMVENQIAVYVATQADKSDAAVTTDYTITGSVDPTKEDTGTFTVTYGGKTLGTITVKVIEKKATAITVDPTAFTVERDTPATETIGEMNVTYEDGTTEVIDLTIAMLQGTKNVNKNGTYTDLYVSYGGKTVEGLTLKVVNKTGVNDFPTYPNPGSVDMKKTATGIDFQNTGVARVELSASGLPAEKGVDVVVVIDTSSSMRYNASGSQVGYDNANSRFQIMTRSLKQMLTSFQAANPTTGVIPDIDVAIIDFNGYGSSNYIDNASLDDQYRTDADNSKVYTVNGAAQTITGLSEGLTANHFMKNTSIDVDSMVAKFTTGQSGTNYDVAFQNAYDLLKAK